VIHEIALIGYLSRTLLIQWCLWSFVCLALHSDMNFWGCRPNIKHTSIACSTQVCPLFSLLTLPRIC